MFVSLVLSLNPQNTKTHLFSSNKVNCKEKNLDCVLRSISLRYDVKVTQ